MYLVIDKKTKKVLHENPSPVSKKISKKSIWKKFDPKSMEIIELANEELFEIENGIFSKKPEQTEVSQEMVLTQIVEKQEATMSEFQRIEDNKVMQIALEELIASGKIELNEPFEQLVDGEIEQFSLEYLIANDLLSTKAHWEKALDFLRAKIEGKIAKELPIGLEMKITKEYIAWINDGKPTNDNRSVRYEEMQNLISSIKEQHDQLKTQIQSKISSLGN